MNPLLALPVLAAVLAGLVAAQKKQAGSSGSGTTGTAQELQFAQFLNSQAAQAQAISASNAATNVVNNFNPSALIAQDMQSSGFQSSISKIVDNSTGALQTEINALTNVVNQIPKGQTIQVNAPAPAGPSPGFLGINTWF
jgi:hypothetical protein